MRVLVFLAAVLIAAPQFAAAQQVKAISSPSGVTFNQVKCKTNSAKCMKKAGQHCKGSYQVIDSDSHAGGLLADIMPGPVTWYQLTFLCGKSDGRMPTFAFRGPDVVNPALLIPQSTRVRCNTVGSTTNCYSY
ncbi:hypothetical protein [Ruegeria conchae]|uniref:Uncharacterized protein n=1 Tax=Ruegeria conchae TaxID=981384 RepID=A0A497ZJH4_9RHOB|nr:hypothetical protein [Ruegeria conchae]RLK07428.1 hypothetical protein CLV75_2551 [Ruegeria conchae]